VADGGIYFIFSNSIQRFDLETEQITELLLRERILRDLTVSPDGEWIVWGEQVELDLELVLLENFK
jgi:hypothetical protein